MSVTPPRPTKRERRDAARALRREKEAAALASEARARRLKRLGAVVAAAVLVVVGVVLLGTRGGDGSGTPKLEAGETVAGQRLSGELLDGIPQSGITLGRSDAKVTIVELADLQCPICATFAQQVLPRVVEDHVRTGQAKIELRLVDILDRGGITDSARMAAVAYGAQQQNRLWNFADLQFFNQGEEDTGYATDAHIRRIAAGVKGLDVDRAFAARRTEAARQELATADALFTRYGAQGTPTVLVGPTGGQLQKVDHFDNAAISSAIKAAAR
jgi:protein-disulfide isomerase